MEWLLSSLPASNSRRESAGTAGPAFRGERRSRWHGTGAAHAAWPGCKGSARRRKSAPPPAGGAFHAAERRPVPSAYRSVCGRRIRNRARPSCGTFPCTACSARPARCTPCASRTPAGRLVPNAGRSRRRGMREWASGCRAFGASPREELRAPHAAVRTAELVAQPEPPPARRAHPPEPAGAVQVEAERATVQVTGLPGLGDAQLQDQVGAELVEPGADHVERSWSGPEAGWRSGEPERCLPRRPGGALAVERDQAHTSNSRR